MSDNNIVSRDQVDANQHNQQRLAELRAAGEVDQLRVIGSNGLMLTVAAAAIMAAFIRAGYVIVSPSGWLQAFAACVAGFVALIVMQRIERALKSRLERRGWRRGATVVAEVFAAVVCVTVAVVAGDWYVWSLLIGSYVLWLLATKALTDAGMRLS